MSADALVSDVTRAPVDVMLPMCIFCRSWASIGVDFFHIPAPYACQGMLENFAFLVWPVWRGRTCHYIWLLPDEQSSTWRSYCSSECSRFNLRGFNDQTKFQRIHLKRYVARSQLCCVLSHRYKYWSFNQYCSGLLHRQWGKHIVASIGHN